MKEKKLMMGNEAAAFAALDAGASVVCGYPGTPSSGVVETAAKHNPGGVYVEWSVNEKVAAELAAGASCAGARVMVTMEQAGLSVASDPVLDLVYVGTGGGVALYVADDPGPVSSQTEQDTRHFGKYANIPVFDPSTPQELYEMVFAAFALSEEIRTPVLVRPTTSVCHACAPVERREREAHPPAGFQKDPKWVIFPRTSYLNHIALEQKQIEVAKAFSESGFNRAFGSGRLGVAASGVSYNIAAEAIERNRLEVRLYKLSTPYPFPERFGERMLVETDSLLVLEELDPVNEEALFLLAGKLGLRARIRGKLSGDLPKAGEYTYGIVEQALLSYCGAKQKKAAREAPPPLPARPPTLCAGCPHRASFYAVKRALKGKKAVFCGDVGCYTLGNAKPLCMTDACLCMGGGITVAQGLARAGNDAKQIAFIGDSTFFHSGITGVINAVYNRTDITVIVLDNATTAITGRQPHPGTGKTMMGSAGEAVSIEAVLGACGVGRVLTADPLSLREAEEKVREAVQYEGVSAVIMKSPCAALNKQKQAFWVGDGCVGCRACVREIGCPAISFGKNRAEIDPESCAGCGLCAQICAVHAIGRRER